MLVVASLRTQHLFWLAVRLRALYRNRVRTYNAALSTVLCSLVEAVQGIDDEECAHDSVLSVQYHHYARFSGSVHPVAIRDLHFIVFNQQPSAIHPRVAVSASYHMRAHGVPAPSVVTVSISPVRLQLLVVRCLRPCLARGPVVSALPDAAVWAQQPNY